MLFAIPYQNVILSNVNILQEFTLDKYERKIALINYNDLYNLPIITSKMKIISYDKDKNKLQLDCSIDKDAEQFASKLASIQNHIINYVYTHRKKYFNLNYPELINADQFEIQGLFQTLIKDGILTLFFNKRNTTYFYHNNDIINDDVLVPGNYIKLVLRIHGILLMNLYNNTPLMRIQYSIPYCFT